MRVYQSFSPHMPEQTIRNYVEVFNLVGQKLQKLCIPEVYR